MIVRYVTTIGGTKAAQQRWPARDYAHKRSAQRRAKQIMAAHDLGVFTVWTYKREESSA